MEKIDNYMGNDKQLILNTIRQLLSNYLGNGNNNAEQLINYTYDHYEEIREEATRSWNKYLGKDRENRMIRCPFGNHESEILLIMLNTMNFSTSYENRKIANEIMSLLGYKIYEERPDRFQHKSENIKRKHRRVDSHNRIKLYW